MKILEYYEYYSGVSPLDELSMALETIKKENMIQKCEEIGEILFSREIIFISDKFESKTEIFFGKPLQVGDEKLWQAPYELKEGDKSIFFGSVFQVDALDSFVSAMQMASHEIEREAKKRYMDASR